MKQVRQIVWALALVLTILFTVKQYMLQKSHHIHRQHV